MNHDAVRTKCAKSDLARARRYGELLVGQTAEGTISVSHCAGQYRIVRQGHFNKLTGTFREPVELASGAPKVVLPVLAALYVIVDG